MNVSYKAIELLQQRLKNINNSVDSGELEKLANAVTAISKLETTEDILNISDAKLTELLSFANAKLSNIDNYGLSKQADLSSIKTAKLSEIAASKQSGLTSISNTSSLNQATLNAVVNNFATMNDIPTNSTIGTEITQRLDPCNFLKHDNLPFVLCKIQIYNKPILVSICCVGLLVC
jgi:hypothetical protein